ncbi:HesB/YadR/YfhF family protein [Levilactobacillus cerevisiae]|uniref:HesB/YadR/YfhF family protein n=1 Tax=Levilactobacillus cerevisiae TaxID=1704076 RepID=UPI000F789A23|nr:iron-sulfur cluster biosynthesis protein [Levilactobacillus cerevisiae]
MKITVTDSASKWFRDEMGMTGRGVRFFGKVYGKTPVHEGFSLGMTPDDNPRDPIVAEKKDNVTYYITEGDQWFFVGYDLTIDYDAATDGPTYIYDDNGELDK